MFYSDNGSTAVEVAIRAAFQWQQQRGDVRRRVFVSFEGAYHGDTIGAVSVGGIDEFHARFGLRLERLCAQTLESLVEAGLVSVSDDAITLTREGMLHGDTSGKALARQLMEHY